MLAVHRLFRKASEGARQKGSSLLHPRPCLWRIRLDRGCVVKARHKKGGSSPVKLLCRVGNARGAAGKHTGERHNTKKWVDIQALLLFLRRTPLLKKALVTAA